MEHWLVPFLAFVGSVLGPMLPPLFSGIAKLFSTYREQGRRDEALEREQARKDEESAITGYQRLVESLQAQVSAVWLKVAELERENAQKDRQMGELRDENTELRERLSKLESKGEQANVDTA